MKSGNYYDFSCKHDIMIQNPDGTLSPMDEPFFQAEKIAPDTWKILSSGDFQYLLAGDGEALVLDTGYGAGNLRKFCEELCGIPVPYAANTHEHFDHTANNGRFDLVYMTEACRKNATVPYKSFEGILFPRDYPVKTVKTGDLIPLKGRELEVIEIADHSPGGAVYLDRKQRILFTGDEIWQRKPLNRSVQQYLAYLEKIGQLREEFDILYAGCGMIPATVVDKQIENCRKVLAGDRGTPAEAPKGPPPFACLSTETQIIYDRQFPHPGDNAGDLWGMPRPDMAKMRAVTTDDVTLLFCGE